MGTLCLDDIFSPEQFVTDLEIRDWALRFMQGEPPPLEDVLKTMTQRAAKFNTEKVKQEDLASAAGAPDSGD